MSLVLTKEYTERTLDLVKLKKWKFNNRKRDSKACQKPTQKLTQSFVSEDFYFGFWIWTKFVAVLWLSINFLHGFLVPSVNIIEYPKS